ncbi:unnamed protein product [Caenorhabditis bovis]|uniref:Methyltransferase FkbM domain-containing protein n=1 Tax=Caenorhabditis bovis TaxID=2654633 RepID=A0A8S1F2L1_9PELO|nr:unnamed protein product [Caenorhabditis bovis]
MRAYLIRRQRGDRSSPTTIMRSPTILIFVLVVLLCVVVVLLMEPSLSVGVSLIQLGFETSASLMLNEWRDCMRANITKFRHSTPDEVWRSAYIPIVHCEASTRMAELDMKAFTNSDETKYAILPKTGESCNLVTIGVGQDTQAEIGLREALGADHINFFGVDPIIDGNLEKYTQIGRFYPFAIGNSSEVGESSVLTQGAYHTQNVIHIEMIVFLRNIANIKMIDHLWLDGEGAEYELFDYFYKNGKFDENGITICQFNMEMHEPNDARKSAIQSFLIRLFDDARFAFFRPVQATHLRLFFVNFADRACVAKYLQQR